jgi:hypothetical protein
LTAFDNASSNHARNNHPQRQQACALEMKSPVCLLPNDAVAIQKFDTP